MASVLHRSGHEDSFARDRLPPAEQWPQLLEPPHGIVYPDRLNAAAELLDSAVRAGRENAVALRGAGLVWTYAELSDRVDRIAHVLRSDFKLPTGARVLLRGANHPMLAACWLAVLKAGCIAVTTMPLLRARELSVIAERAQINAALCDASLLEAWQEVRASRPGSGPVLGYGGVTSEPGSLEHAMASHSEPFQAADTAQDDVALIAFTSGTTGQPKGTMHFHRDCLLIADVLARHLLDPTPADVFIGTPPLAFTFGLGGLLIFPLRAGACAVLEPQWTAESLLQGIDSHRASICFTAPTFYRRMAGLAQREQLR
jgi:2-aminobenzoate-CoA ligase